MFQNELKNCSREQKGDRYHEDVKKFVLIVHFYSPRAYSYLRTIFSLPHPSSIRIVTSFFNFEPGFHQDLLKHLSVQLETTPKMIDCTLMMDTMANRKLVSMTPKIERIQGLWITVILLLKMVGMKLLELLFSCLLVLSNTGYALLGTS